MHDYIGGELAKLKISFVSPEKLFWGELGRGVPEGGYELAVCAGAGNWNDETGECVYHGHVIHLIKKEKLSVRMRSRFWLGDVEDREVRKGLVPEFLPRGLCQHATEEMAILADVLPGLYEKFARKDGDGGIVNL